MFAARLGVIDAVSTLGISYLFFMAIRCRRKVHLHARYMITTIFFLFGPILGRLAPALPPLSFSGPADMHRFGWGVHLSHAAALLITYWLYRRAPKHGRPFVVVGSLIALQSLLFETLAKTAAWEVPFSALVQVPTPLIASLGLAGGVAVVWAGWNGNAPGRAAVRTA
jgi:hypothetical protein